MSIKAKQSLRGSNNVGDVLKGEPGAPGKSAYEYAQEAGYTGTEEEFAEKLASDKAGASSWNDLTDKPFGEEQAFEPIVWDGNIEGLEVIEDGSQKMVRISSLKITDPTNIENLVFGNIENGETTTVTDFQVRQQGDGIFELQGGLVMLVNNTSFGVSEGVWAMLMDDNPAFIAEINPKTTTIPLSEKYLPDTIAHTSDIPEIPEVPTKLSELENDSGFVTADDLPEGFSGSWNDLADKPFGETVVGGLKITEDDVVNGEKADIGDGLWMAKVSDEVYTVADFAGLKIVYFIDGNIVTEDAPVIIDDMVPNCVAITTSDGQTVAYAVSAPMELPTGNMISAGLWFGGNDYSGGYKLISFEVAGTTIVTPIDAKYLPESVGKVKTVNGAEPDENGNVEVEVEFPETSWNDLADKPFGEKKAFEPIVWDSSMSGLEVFSHEQLMGVRYFKMGAYFQLENASDVESLTARMMVDGQQMEDTNHGGADIREHGWLVADSYVVASDGNFELTGGTLEGIVFPNGIWFMDLTAIGAEQASLALNPSITIKPIETKYLPEALQFGMETKVKGDTLTWDGNTNGLLNISGMFFLVSEQCPTPTDMPNGLIERTSDGQEDTLSEEYVQQIFDETGVVLCEGVLIVYQDNTLVGDGFIAPKAGIYFICTEEDGEKYYTTSITIPGYNVFETTVIKPLDEKYLPESVKGGGGGADLLDENGILKQEYLPEGFPYKSGEDVEILPSTTLTVDPESGVFTIPNTINTSELSAGAKCVVRFEVAGEAFEYEVTAKELPESDEGFKWALGNIGLMGDGDDTGEPFLIGLYAREVAAETGIGGIMGGSFAVESMTVSIAVFVGAFALIDPMYLPPHDPETIVVNVTGSFIVGSQQNNITATHTYNQIMELLNNGKNVALHRRDYESAQAIEIYTLSDFGYGKARFIHTEINNASVKCMQIQVCHSLTQYWEYSEVNIESLSSAEGGSF